MTLPILKNVEAILDSYSPSTHLEPVVTKFVRNAFDSARYFITNKGLLRRDSVSVELKEDIKNAHTAEKWIEIIDSLAALARRAQEGGLTYSHLCKMLHAARTYIVECLKKDEDTNKILTAKVKHRLALFEEANEPERTARKNGYVPNKSIAGDILLTIADLGDDDAILDASDKKLFANLEFPPKNAAPATDYIDDVSEAPEYNVNFPLCYHRDYYQKYCADYGVKLEVESPSISTTQLSTSSRSEASLSEVKSSAPPSPFSLASTNTILNQLQSIPPTPSPEPSSEPQPSASTEKPAEERTPSPPPVVAPAAEPANSKTKNKPGQGKSETSAANDPSTQPQRKKGR